MFKPLFRQSFGFLRGCFSMALFLLNTLLLSMPFFSMAILKFCLPLDKRCVIESAINRLVELWIQNNSFILLLTQKIDWDVECCDGLDPKCSYLVVSNHQSWADVPVIQWVLNRKIPLLRFFIKQELRWVPILGLAWVALDFPCMKRYSKEQLRKQPHLQGVDMETTKQLCRRFKDKPVSIMNFLEGTRFTPQKHEEQNSEFKSLLKPKAGGVAFALNAMGGQITQMLDITLVYHSKRYGVWGLMCGRITAVTVRMSLRKIPASLISGDYQGDAVYREGFQCWMNATWEQKDQLIQSIRDKKSASIAA